MANYHFYSFLASGVAVVIFMNKPCPFCGHDQAMCVAASHENEKYRTISCLKCGSSALESMWNTRENEELESYRKALELIAAQDSGIVGSTDKADCLAGIAQAVLNRTKGS